MSRTAKDPNADMNRITAWAATKMAAVMVLTLCDQADTYVIRSGVDRHLVAEKLRKMAYEVENT